GVILALMLPAVVIIFFLPGTIISLIASDKYLSAVPILQITIFYTLFLPFARQFGTILDSVGLPNINFYITAGNALMNVILNYVFIRSFGMIGAAYGTLLTYLLGFILMQVVIRQKLKVEFSKTLVHITVFYKEIWVSFAHFVSRKQ
ncbi:MAG: polysaccharide biosynthesis C-terminal domain-containing protein, partial [Cyclobacteriaceae bacterium]